MGSHILANEGAFTFQARVPLAWRYREDPDTRPRVNSYFPRERLYIQRDKVSYLRNGAPYFIPDHPRIRREINPECPIHGHRIYRNRPQRRTTISHMTAIRDSISEASSESTVPYHGYSKHDRPHCHHHHHHQRHRVKNLSHINHSHLPHPNHISSNRVSGHSHTGEGVLLTNDYVMPITKFSQVGNNPGHLPVSSNVPLPSRIPTLKDHNEGPCSCYQCCHGYRKFIWLLWIIIIVGAITGIVVGVLYTRSVEKHSNSAIQTAR